MKKLSAHGRKLVRQQQQEAAQALEKKLREVIKADVRGLQIDAGIHSWTGNNAANMINLVGRLCYIVTYAATEAGITAFDPDMRILRGLGEALGDLAAHMDYVERFRPSIQSGLAAIDRLLPKCDDIDLANAAFSLDQLLARPQGMGTADLRNVMGIAA